MRLLNRIRLTRFLRISAANIGPNLFHQTRTVSWLISMPRSCRRSSTLWSESGNRTYSITAKRMISGLVLKYLNGECFVIWRSYESSLPASSSFCLTVPQRCFSYLHGNLLSLDMATSLLKYERTVVQSGALMCLLTRYHNSAVTTSCVIIDLADYIY